MNLSKLRGLLFLLLLYVFVLAEAKSRKAERKFKKNSKTESKTHGHNGKKQFFPVAMGQAGQYPANPYPMMQQRPVTDPNQKVKFAKGLPRAYDCSHSKHGCCWDGRTPAFGPSGTGCPQCRDVYEDFCKRTKELCDTPMIADYCRMTCKLCSKKKTRSCQSTNYNCCWDGKTSAKGPKGQGCPKIIDDPSAKCQKYESECLRNAYYMWTKCRETCIKNLPPIEPFLQGLGPVNDLGIPPPCGQPSTFPGMPPGQNAPEASYPLPYPGMPQGLNSTMRKKTTTKNMTTEKKHKETHHQKH